MVIAHAGHWLVDSIFFLPVIAFGIWLAVITIRDRHRD
jgi:hypothetical protein